MSGTSEDITSPLTVRMPDKMIDAIDDLVDRGLYSSRQELIRQSVRQTLLTLKREGLTSFAEVVA